MSIMENLEHLDNHTQFPFSWLQERMGSTEAIKFQAKSKFPEELKAQMQRILDFCNEHDQKFGEVTNSDEAYRKHAKVKKFIVNDAGAKLKKIVKKHTGITISRIHSEYPLSTDEATNIFVSIKNPDTAIFDMINATEGLVEKQLDPKNDKKLRELVDISKSLDRDRGKILGNIKNLEVVIGLSVGVFTTRDYVRKGEQYQMTAAEVTACFLHELGHIFAWIEYMGDLTYTGYYGNNPIRDLEDRMKNDPEGTTDEAISLAKEVQKNTNNKTVKAFMERSETLLSKLSDPDQAGSGYDRGIGHFLLMTLIRSIIAVFIFSSLIVTIPVIYALTSSGNRSGRDKSSLRPHVMYERLADEYVSRYKMSLELNQALIKRNKLITALVKVGWGDPVFKKATRESLFLIAAWNILAIPSSVGNIGFIIMNILLDPVSPYEEHTKRLKRNLNNLVDVLNSTKVSPELRKELVQDIEKIEQQLRVKSTRFQRSVASFVRLIMNLPVSVPAETLNQLLGDAGTAREYAKLFEQLDEMLSNKSGYHAAKIQNIFDKD